MNQSSLSPLKRAFRYIIKIIFLFSLLLQSSVYELDINAQMFKTEVNKLQ